MTILDSAPLVAAKTLADKHIGVLVVVEQTARLAGPVSEREIVRAFARYGANAFARRVRDVIVDALTVFP